MTTPHTKSAAGLPERRLLLAARDALRSYQYGNASPELAEEVADRIDAYEAATQLEAALRRMGYAASAVTE